MELDYLLECELMMIPLEKETRNQATEYSNLVTATFRIQKCSHLKMLSSLSYHGNHYKPFNIFTNLLCSTQWPCSQIEDTISTEPTYFFMDTAGEKRMRIGNDGPQVLGIADPADTHIITGAELGQQHIANCEDDHKKKEEFQLEQEMFDNEDGLMGGEVWAKDVVYTKLTETWLEVPKSLVWVRSVVEGVFEAKIRFVNLTDFHITYNIIRTKRQFFAFCNAKGVVPPKRKCEVIVVSRLDKVKDFGDICTTGFIILATPVYFQSQLQTNKIKLLWQICGSDLFPNGAAEMHKINIMVPKCDSYMDNYNIIQRASLGNFVSPRWIEGVKSRPKSIKASDFIKNWAPNESNKEIEFVLRRHEIEMIELMRSLRGEIRSMWTWAQILFLCTMTVGVSFGLYNYLPFELSSIGPNGQRLDQMEEERPWWKFF